MRVGLLQCDAIPAPHGAIDGDYDILFATLLDGQDIELVTYRVDLDDLPRSPTDCDGWLIGGSQRSAYDDEAWIGRLTRFAAGTVASERPLVGVCFGHQVVARALGAEVARVGWTMGAVEYQLHRPTAVSADGPSFTIVASHQDQVLELPAGTELLATSPGCPVAGFVTPTVLTLQGHPEFTTRLGASLTAGRRDALGDEACDAALASLERQVDSGRVAAWIGSFLERQR